MPGVPRRRQRAAEAGAQRAGPVQRDWASTTRVDAGMSDGSCLRSSALTTSTAPRFTPSLLFNTSSGMLSARDPGIKGGGMAPLQPALAICAVTVCKNKALSRAKDQSKYS
ncbi:hypothetical protein NDU88_004817 [Pleurodeles waltl]|uniref:Uncharacterized protein n=1 Tax=Pleurodeles waltl TaxID=8319 RepID=A0AAV7UGM0_PLEWA|nr:hypothetical protein NDU88_004817 [Pleurodeles waltl]